MTMIQKSPDKTIQKIDMGFMAVLDSAIEKARQTNTKLVVWQDNKIIEIEPEERANHKNEKT